MRAMPPRSDDHSFQRGYQGWRPAAGRQVCRVSRRCGADDRGFVSTLPQQPAPMLFAPNSPLFGSKLPATRF